MDDDKVTRAMTLERLSAQLESATGRLDARINEMQREVRDGFARVDGQLTEAKSRDDELREGLLQAHAKLSQGLAHAHEKLNEGLAHAHENLNEGLAQAHEKLNEGKVRDEELRDFMKFGLEARESLRESMEARFDEADRKHDEQIGLLRAVLHDVTKRARNQS